MLRICLIIAIVAGLAAAAISFTKVKEIIDTTRRARDEWHTKDDQEVAAHGKTKGELKKTQATLATTQKDLESTKGELAAANSKVDDLTKNNADLNEKLTKTTGERDDAQAQLERWNHLPPPEQIRAIIADLEKTQKARDAVIGENKLLVKKVNDWQDRWNNFFGSSGDPILPAGLRGKILAVDPKFNFVVLNIGEDQGAKPRGIMMIDKDGRLLGKVRISNVTKTECVANIIPEWTRGEIMEGDEVLY